MDEYKINVSGRKLSSDEKEVVKNAFDRFIESSPSGKGFYVVIPFRDYPLRVIING